MPRYVLLGAACWAVWALTARSLYQGWAATERAAMGDEGSYGLIAFVAFAYALLLPVALATVLMHRAAGGRTAGEQARLREAAIGLDQATARLAAANDACQREIDRAGALTIPGTPKGGQP